MVNNELVTIPTPEVEPGYEKTLLSDGEKTVTIQYTLDEEGVGPLVIITTGGNLVCHIPKVLISWLVQMNQQK
jgi:hypothetical protein